MVLYCFASPVLPGGERAMKEWAAKGIKGNKAHDAAFRSLGISRETVWLQRTPNGDFAVVAMELTDPAKAFKGLATSDDAWVKQFREFVKRAHGIDLTQAIPPNEAIVDWKA